MELSDFFPFWEQLSPQEQTLLEESATPRTYKKGAILHDGTQDCTGLLLLTDGQMRAYTVTEEGRELTLFRLLPGEICTHSRTMGSRSTERCARFITVQAIPTGA